MDIDFAVHTRLYLGLYEVELNRYLRDLCSGTADCFDIGGQFGYDALVFAKLSAGRIVSFECDPVVCDDLVRNIGLNSSVKDRIKVVEAFVGSITDETNNRVALDDMIVPGQLFIPDFVKMDIEGGEYDALLGAQKLLSYRGTNFLIETHSQLLEEQCLGLLESYGYSTKIVNQRRFLRDYRPAEHNRWLVAVPGPAA